MEGMLCKKKWNDIKNQIKYSMLAAINLNSSKSRGPQTSSHLQIDFMQKLHKVYSHVNITNFLVKYFNYSLLFVTSLHAILQFVYPFYLS